MAAKESERYIRCYPMTTDCYQPSVNDMFFSAFINFKCLVQASPLGPISTCVLSKGAKTDVVDTRQPFFFLLLSTSRLLSFHYKQKQQPGKKTTRRMRCPRFFLFLLLLCRFPSLDSLYKQWRCFLLPALPWRVYGIWARNRTRTYK